jgi:hypothetical protein
MAKNKIGDANNTILVYGSNIIYPHKICSEHVLQRSLHNYQIEGVLTITNSTKAMRVE